MGKNCEDHKHGEGPQIARAGQHREARDTPTGEHHANAKHDTSDKDCCNWKIACQQTVIVKRDISRHSQKLRAEQGCSQGDKPDAARCLSAVSCAHNSASEAKLEMLGN